MRQINFSQISEAVAKAVAEANIFLPDDICLLLKEAKEKENSPTAKEVYDIIEQNIAYAKTSRLPLCQDTGTAVCFIKLGQEIHINGGLLYDAVNAGVTKGY